MRALGLAGLVTMLTSGCAPIESMPSAGVEPGTPQRCDAAGARSLIGSHVGAVSFAADANVRVVCTTCPTTRDLRPDRLNVRFDQATGIIKAVDCG